MSRPRPKVLLDADNVLQAPGVYCDTHANIVGLAGGRARIGLSIIGIQYIEQLPRHTGWSDCTRLHRLLRQRSDSSRQHADNDGKAHGQRERFCF